MKIYIIAKAGSRKEFVKQVDETHFTVAVHEPPIDGKANLNISKNHLHNWRLSLERPRNGKQSRSMNSKKDLIFLGR